MRLRAFWYRLRVAVFLRSVRCRHDGTLPLCLWCGLTALEFPVLHDEELAGAQD